MKIIINDIEYKVVEDYRDCFDLEIVKEKLKDVDYFDNYDFILGDYSYDKLRLKGFYKKDNENVNKVNNYDDIKDYIKDYCSFGCRYFIIEKVENNKKHDKN